MAVPAASDGRAFAIRCAPPPPPAQPHRPSWNTRVRSRRSAGVAASGHGFRSSFKDWARQHDVVLSEFALAHVEGSATVAAYARDDPLEKRRPVMQRWADCIAGWQRSSATGWAQSAQV